MKTNSHLQKWVYLLTVFHFPFLWETLWYDESALLENASHVGILEFTSGLNWLQTIPFGYFLISKTMLLLPGGLFVLRLLSLVFLIWGIRIIDQYFLTRLRNSRLRLSILMIMILNSFSLTYGTDSKPYTLEFLLSAAFIVVSAKRQFISLLLLGIFAPFLAASSFITGSGCIATVAIRTRSPKYLIPFLGLVGSTLLNSLLIPESTKRAMQFAWFGDLAKFDFHSIKSAIGGILWIPTSGLGVIPEGLALESSYVVSGVIFCSTMLFVIVKSWRTELTQKLAFTTLLALVLHSLLLVPVAGRLMQGLALLLLLSFALNLDDLSIDRFRMKLVHLLVAGISVASVIQKYDSFEIRKPIASHLSSGQVYANIWAGPEVQDVLRHKGRELSPNLIIEAKNGKLITCASEQFLPGDNLVVQNVDFSMRSELFKLKQLEVRFSTSTTVVLKVLNPMTTLSVDVRSNYFECIHPYRNSELTSSL